MTQEDKQLLFKDLCARSPYGVKCHYDCVVPIHRRELIKINSMDTLKGIIPMPDGHIGFMVGIDKVDALEGDIKPYLRPMSSMTEEEKENLQSLHDIISNENYGDGYSPSAWDAITEWEDYCNSRHLDYRGLIPMGLALEASEDMYKTE